MKKKILAVVGPIASGKGTAIQILRDKFGYESSSTSDRVREELRKRGEEITRESLTRVANELRETYGTDVLAQRTAKIIEESGTHKFVIDSIRNPEEIQYFKKLYELTVISLNADQKVRYERFINRKENSQKMSFDEFKKLDDEELEGTKGNKAQNVKRCMEMADISILNSKSKEDLEESLTQALSELGLN